MDLVKPNFLGALYGELQRRKFSIEPLPASSKLTHKGAVLLRAATVHPAGHYVLVLPSLSTHKPVTFEWLELQPHLPNIV
jgi:hypothetical protein